jgi:NTE family protein
LGWSENAIRLAIVTDQLDHANFPQHGHRFKWDLQTGRTRQSGQERQFFRWDGNITGVFTSGAHTWNAYLRLASSNHVPQGAVDEYSLGGFQNLSGYRVGQVVGNNLMLARLNYYRRLPLQTGLARAVFVGATAELGNAWEDRRQMTWGNLHFGSSLYIGADTAVGPVYLSLVHAPGGYTGLYFLLGKP